MLSSRVSLTLKSQCEGLGTVHIEAGLGTVLEPSPTPPPRHPPTQPTTITTITRKPPDQPPPQHQRRQNQTLYLEYRSEVWVASDVTETYTTNTNYTHATPRPAATQTLSPYSTIAQHARQDTTCRNPKTTGSTAPANADTPTNQTQTPRR